MKKIIAVMMSSSAILVTGCASVPQAKVEIIDKEPILVGKSVAQRISESGKEINEQFELLNRVQTGGKIGNFAIVQHNNNLDARVGSDNTIPQAYAKINEPVKKEPKEKIIKKIQWDNNSLNKLVGNFATAMGYQVFIKPGFVTDKNINFVAEKVTIEQALALLKTQMKDIADIVVVDKSKTINVFYK